MYLIRAMFHTALHLIPAMFHDYLYLVLARSYAVLGVILAMFYTTLYVIRAMSYADLYLILDMFYIDLYLIWTCSTRFDILYWPCSTQLYSHFGHVLHSSAPHAGVFPTYTVPQLILYWCCPRSCKSECKKGTGHVRISPTWPDELNWSSSVVNLWPAVFTSRAIQTWVSLSKFVVF